MCVCVCVCVCVCACVCVCVCVCVCARESVSSVCVCVCPYSCCWTLFNKEGQCLLKAYSPVLLCCLSVCCKITHSQTAHLHMSIGLCEFS